MCIRDRYTVWQQKTAVRNSRYSTLSAYQAQFENTLRVTEDFLTDTVVNSMDFASIIYARTKTDAYVASQAVGVPCKVQLKANELLGSFCTYSKAFDYYRISYTGSYPQSDLAVLRAAVMAAAEAGSSAAGWIPLSFSDRTVLLNTYVRNQTVFAAMIDPVSYTHLDVYKRQGLFPDDTHSFAVGQQNIFRQSADPLFCFWCSCFALFKGSMDTIHIACSQESRYLV